MYNAYQILVQLLSNFLSSFTTDNGSFCERIQSIARSINTELIRSESDISKRLNCFFLKGDQVTRSMTLPDYTQTQGTRYYKEQQLKYVQLATPFQQSQFKYRLGLDAKRKVKRWSVNLRSSCVQEEL